MKHIKENEKICVNDILYEGLSTISMENDWSTIYGDGVSVAK